MKVIFLDFDGVLNNETTAFFFGYDNPTLSHYDQACPDHNSVRLIDILVRKSNAKIVVSSSWRNGRDIDQLQDVLGNEFGLCTWDQVIDKTTSSPMNSWIQRGSQIQEWLDAHTEVTEYVIIDDDASMLRHQKKHFVCVNADIGFVYADYLKCLDILKVERK